MPPMDIEGIETPEQIRDLMERMEKKAPKFYAACAGAASVFTSLANRGVITKEECDRLVYAVVACSVEMDLDGIKSRSAPSS